MENLIQQFGTLDFSSAFSTFFLSISQPFVHSFQSVIPKFLPQVKSLILNEPGLIGGVTFVLIFYTSAVLIQQLKKDRVTVTNRKPSSVYREGFPNGLTNKYRDQ